MKPATPSPALRSCPHLPRGHGTTTMQCLSGVLLLHRAALELLSIPVYCCFKVSRTWRLTHTHTQGSSPAQAGNFPKMRMCHRLKKKKTNLPSWQCPHGSQHWPPMCPVPITAHTTCNYTNALSNHHPLKQQLLPIPQMRTEKQEEGGDTQKGLPIPALAPITIQKPEFSALNRGAGLRNPEGVKDSPQQSKCEERSSESCLSRIPRAFPTVTHGAGGAYRCLGPSGAS